TDYTSKVESLEKTVDSLLMKVDDLENRSRRNNLIVFGVKETEDETPQDLENTVCKDVLLNRLKISDVAIERIHRIGRPAEDKCRPVIFKLVDGRIKERILKSCKNLKNTGYSISEDFSPRVQSIRKKLWESAKEQRLKEEKVMLKFDKIKINGKLYRWDDACNERVPCASK
ncbi:uncharacterized protein LOC144127643, partial [Amblyomma americanum]